MQPSREMLDQVARLLNTYRLQAHTLNSSRVVSGRTADLLFVLAAAEKQATRVAALGHVWLACLPARSAEREESSMTLSSYRLQHYTACFKHSASKLLKPKREAVAAIQLYTSRCLHFYTCSFEASSQLHSTLSLYSQVQSQNYRFKELLISDRVK